MYLFDAGFLYYWFVEMGEIPYLHVSKPNRYKSNERIP
jgi:hypothetical protein